MCKYCENDGYYKRNKSLISKTLKNNVDIEFWNDKTISKSSGYEVSYITMQELKAINLKCKELGWIEE